MLRSMNIFLLYGFCFEEVKARDSQEETSDKVGSGIEQRAFLELCSGFEIKNFALHPNHALGNYKKTVVTKRAAHMAVLELPAHLYQSGALWEVQLCNINYRGHEKFTANH